MRVSSSLIEYPIHMSWCYMFTEESNKLETYMDVSMK